MKSEDIQEIYSEIDKLSHEELKETMKKVVQATDEFINSDDLYKKVPWPESQDFMDKEWFEDEAVLDITDSASYFIPYKRSIEDEQ